MGRHKPHRSVHMPVAAYEATAPRASNPVRLPRFRSSFPPPFPLAFAPPFADANSAAMAMPLMAFDSMHGNRSTVAFTPEMVAAMEAMRSNRSYFYVGPAASHQGFEGSLFYL
jgi:hypothetical protein